MADEQSGSSGMTGQAVFWAIVLVALGIFVRATGGLNIVHEVFHYIVGDALGEGAEIVSWDKVRMWGERRTAFLYAGYVGEYLFYGLLVFVFATGGKPLLGWFWYGILFWAWLTAHWSRDFNKPVDYMSVEAREAIVSIWFVAGLAGLLVLQFLLRYFWRCYVSSKAEGREQVVQER